MKIFMNYYGVAMRGVISKFLIWDFHNKPFHVLIIIFIRYISTSVNPRIRINYIVIPKHKQQCHDNIFDTKGK